jgi:hypothetical protein
MVVVRFPAKARFSLLLNVQPPIHWMPEAISSGIKRLVHEADYSNASSVGVKKCGAIFSLPPYSCVVMA